MKIILDFDDTILDTGNQVEGLINIFCKLGFTREEYNFNYERSKEMPNVIAIKMERPTGRHILPKSELADYIVKNFDEVKKIINELSK